MKGLAPLSISAKPTSIRAMQPDQIMMQLVNRRSLRHFSELEMSFVMTMLT